MFRTSEYSSQILWFSVPDEHGRSRMGALCGVRWLGEWPLSLELAGVLLNQKDSETSVIELAARYRHPPRFSQSVLGRFALSELKSRAGNACSEMSFSVSHSDQWAVALGFEDESCGVDLEWGADERHSLRVAKKFISPNEEPLVQASGLSPWAIWCAKEALGKTLGKGLKAPLSQYALKAVHGRCLSFAHFPGYSAAAWDLRRGGSGVASAHLAICIPGAVNLDLGRVGLLSWFGAFK